MIPSNLPNFNDCEDEYCILAHGERAPRVICNQLLKSLASFQKFIVMIVKLGFHLTVKSQSSKQYLTLTLQESYREVSFIIILFVLCFRWLCLYICYLLFLIWNPDISVEHADW